MTITDNQENEEVTVRELIDALSKFDQDSPVRIVLQTHTQAYPSGYFVPSIGEFGVHKAHDGAVRVYVHLGKGYTINKRKNA